MGKNYRQSNRRSVLRRFVLPALRSRRLTIVPPNSSYIVWWDRSVPRSSEPYGKLRLKESDLGNQQKVQQLSMEDVVALKIQLCGEFVSLWTGHPSTSLEGRAFKSKYAQQRARDRAKQEHEKSVARARELLVYIVETKDSGLLRQSKKNNSLSSPDALVSLHSL